MIATMRMLLVICLVYAECANLEDLLHENDLIEEENHGLYDYRVHEQYQNEREENSEYWKNQAQKSLAKKLSNGINTNKAKNVILFMGDGMSIPTLAAARTYLGQKSGHSGEATQLSFEQFPYSGLSKTYCVNAQVADSACSATAYLGGVKANSGTIGVTAAVKRGDCEAIQNPSNLVDSIARWSQKAGKRTGLVTTTRVTHASPAGVYANTPERTWESDTNILLSGKEPKTCPDIATQLINGETGSQLNVILGGGRCNFVPFLKSDECGGIGIRSDKRNLIDDWKLQKATTNHAYACDRDGLLNVPEETDYLLGLFSSSHLPFELDRKADKVPTLTEMTTAAIKTLSKGDEGYFLFVEGGRIDHAHHLNLARHALEETIAFHEAIETAASLTNEEDTLIVVTSDHSHTMTINGYPARGDDILGIGGNGIDKIPYTTLSYANGPGYKKEWMWQRHNVSEDDLDDKNYMYPALVPKIPETHGGDDVGIFSRGPWSHLISGVNEQNTIPHILAYASCVGGGLTACSEQ